MTKGQNHAEETTKVGKYKTQGFSKDGMVCSLISRPVWVWHSWRVRGEGELVRVVRQPTLAFDATLHFAFFYFVVIMRLKPNCSRNQY